MKHRLTFANVIGVLLENKKKKLLKFNYKTIINDKNTLTTNALKVILNGENKKCKSSNTKRKEIF